MSLQHKDEFTLASARQHRPEWFYELSQREQEKQLNRWRFYRQYYRRKWGSEWQAYLVAHYS